MSDGSVWMPELQTTVIALRYDFRNQTGVIELPPLSCTDMTGAIHLFLRIDPNVQRVITYAGGSVDTVYTRMPTGWDAHTPNGRYHPAALTDAEVQP